jgi:hypothetical protein
LKTHIEFQSNLAYLKNPPSGYSHEGVDILGGLDDIKNKVNSNGYTNEYDFEHDIAALLVKAHDGHLGFDGYAFAGVFRWRRSRQITLMAVSSDGKEVPKIWAIQDFNQTRSFEPSAISTINGKDAVEFLLEESQLNAYHDPDAMMNALFYMQPSESMGYFANPPFYPGATTDVTFENGTNQSYPNSALILSSSDWSLVESPEDFYNTFVRFSLSNKRSLAKREETKHLLPRQLRQPKESDFTDDEAAILPVQYPEPVIEHSAADVPLAGFFIETGAGTVGVLMIQTFNVQSIPDDAEEFQLVVEEFIKEAKTRNVAKIVIDLRNNGGGLVMLGYDTYLQFFPSQKPQLLSRYRAHDATNLIGEKLSTLELNSQTVDWYSTPFNYHAYLDADLKAFDNWEDMYGPNKFNDDEFTNLLRYNLSDPLVTSSDRFSVGITMTGYGDRSQFTDDPFPKEDIILLSDGICASTCALFTELMVQQSQVKTIAIGGRQALGPMQAVGGTKGSLVLRAEGLISLSEYVLQEFATSNSEARDWAETLPNYFAINVNEASINFQDNIRKGLEKDGIPTQFLNDTASCRLFYAQGDYLNVTQLWTRVAEVGFGKDGGLDDQACVAGSVTSQEAQQGQGEGSPTTPEGSASPSKSKGAAPALRPDQGGWTAILVCGAVVTTSMMLGASLI